MRRRYLHVLHEPAAKNGNEVESPYKTRLGAWMFLIYAVVYGGFVAINVIKPVLMETLVVFGLNLAVVYGFGLIIFALVLALIYNHKCLVHEKEHVRANVAGDASANSTGEDS